MNHDNELEDGSRQSSLDEQKKWLIFPNVDSSLATTRTSDPSSSILWNRVVLSILITETAERVAFFGFRAILVLYFTHGLQFPESTAVAYCAATVALSYFSPLLGAVLADSSWGRYQTIWRFGCIYVVGLCCLTWASYGVPNYRAGEEVPQEVPDNLTMARTITFVGLFCACLGTGGIKPCVSAFGADQVAVDDHGDEARMKKAEDFEDELAMSSMSKKQQERTRAFFNSFYFAINVGALGSFALIPMVRAKFGFGASFLIPTISMILALLVFRAHRNQYKHRVRDESQHSLAEVLRVSLRILKERVLEQCLGESRRHSLVPGEDADTAGLPSENTTQDQVHQDASQALHLLPLMAFFPVFWMLYDQQGSVWTLQATRMNLHGLQPEQLQFLNPLEIMIFIPLFDMKIYPWLERHHFNIQPLRRMEYGMFLTAAAFAMSTFVEYRIRSREDMSVSVTWQVPQITILTIGEILLNVTGLEFAYSQAPSNMQALILALYLFMTAIGDGLGALLYGSVFSYLSAATAMLICAVAMLINMFLFALVSRSWKPHTMNRDVEISEGTFELGPVNKMHNMEHQH